MTGHAARALVAAAAVLAMLAFAASSAGQERTAVAFPGKNGKLAYAAGLRSAAGDIPLDLYVLPAAGSKPVKLVDGGHGGSWSPDGTRIAYMAGESTSEVYVLDVATGATTQVTKNAYNDGSPDWSPDGKQLVFTRRVGPMDTPYRIVAAGVNGGDEHTVHLRARAELVARRQALRVRRRRLAAGVPDGQRRGRGAPAHLGLPLGGELGVVAGWTQACLRSPRLELEDPTDLCHRRRRLGPAPGHLVGRREGKPGVVTRRNRARLHERRAARDLRHPSGRRNGAPPHAWRQHALLLRPLVAAGRGCDRDGRRRGGGRRGRGTPPLHDRRRDGHDVICGTSHNDLIFPGKGNDVVYAGPGDDTVNVSAGDDRLYGEAGSDSLYDGDGADLIAGGTGKDFLNADDHFGSSGSAADTVLGGPGDDEIATHDEARDVVDGGAGFDKANTDAGIDVVTNVEQAVGPGGQPLR